MLLKIESVVLDSSQLFVITHMVNDHMTITIADEPQLIFELKLLGNHTSLNLVATS